MSGPDPSSSRTRSVLPSVQPMYAAALTWRDEALIGDRSLFSGLPMDGLAAAQELVQDFIEQPDESPRDFLSKLRDQLSATSAAGVQLAGELLYVHTLIVSTEAFKGKNKLDLVNRALAIAEGTTPVPDNLVKALHGGVARPGQAYLNYRWKMFSYLIRVVEGVKTRPAADRAAALTDWDAFQHLLEEVDDQSVWTQRYALEHLLFPDTAPALLSRDNRAKVVEVFASAWPDGDGSVERVVASLEPNVVYGDRGGVNLYRTPYRERWQGAGEQLRNYAHWGRRLATTVDLDQAERQYKLERVDRIQQLFRVADTHDDPAAALRDVFRDYNVVDFRVADTFVRWAEADPAACCDALRALALDPGPESVDRFVALVPREAAAGIGAQLSIASALLMGLDPANLPPWRSEAAETTRRLTGGNHNQEAAPPGEHYLSFLERLDAIRPQVNATDTLVRDRLDTQGLAWTIAKTSVDELTPWTDAERQEFEAWRSGKPTPTPPPPPDPHPDDSPSPELTSLEDLAEQLSMASSDWLEESLALLKEKKQLIFQGPPGTGKTYIARQLARYLAGDPSRVTTVQFHPGTSYEDFVQGLRPDPSDPSRFTVVDGPLIRLSHRAAGNRDHNYVLIIDEINRGNVPAVFGELYYLLEYRDDEMTLLYGENHRLPKNLYIIGTMNTADRSITTLDSALRRRFYVQDLDPTTEPLTGILRTFLERAAPDLTWLADLLDTANQQLDHPDLAIGPSHFMGADISEARARRAWKHSVLPTLRDYFHSNPAKLDAFDFDNLKAQVQVIDALDADAE